jgi:succinate dehydrogenase / fumarate reductase flavoprotein subunit
MMGGIATNVDGQVTAGDDNSPFPGLYAAGECACVSVHGANRLGCNALLELLVFGRRTGGEIRRFIHTIGFSNLPPDFDRDALHKIRSLMEDGGKEKIGPLLFDMQELMMDNVSVFREQDGLSDALAKVRQLKERYKEVAVHDKGSCFNRELLEAVELGNMLDLTELITMGALQREESRGAHYREDFPERNDENWLVHTMAKLADNGEPHLFYQPVTITKFQPRERKY